MAEPILSCRGVWKLFGSAPERFLREHNGAPSREALVKAGYIAAVRDASLEVAPGEILIVMGLSGSGKSTLLRCLARLIEPTAGEIVFEGDDLLSADAKQMIELRRHKMGMVFQHFALLPHRTVLQNVAFPLEVQGIARVEREKRALEMIELVGLDGREGYYPRELSGGQQQRVGIARSLAVGPDLWFLDEPFSALDPLIRREMQDEFLRLQNVLQKTIVFVTHDFDEALRLADRIAIMYEGEIVQIGTAEELVTNPATDYVREFTNNIAKEQFLTVRQVMSEPNGTSLGDIRVGIDDKLSDVARNVLDADGPISVVDPNGALVGQLTRNRVMDALFPAKEP